MNHISQALPKLIADIGGTNARFALCEGTVIRDEVQLHCADYPDIESAVRYYLNSIGEKRSLQEAAFDIAAPLSGDQISMTNNNWRFSIAALRKELGLQRLIVLNDFTALAMAIRHLPAHELQQVGGSKNANNTPIALLGAGTGLGVSGLIPSGEHWLPLQGEGGHVSLAPGNEREAEVLKTLWRSFEHVSVERVLSGMGLINLYNAICKLEGVDAQTYTAANITERGLDDSDKQCAEVLQMFCGLLGSVAGNLVLTLGATQAVYIGGGIVPRFGEYFARSSFRERFESKGRYVSYLKPVPVYVIHTPQPAFVGLAQAFVSPGPRIEVSG
ncbi:MAG: glucokinase [Steroidobacteraceae bacterium]